MTPKTNHMTFAKTTSPLQLIGNDFVENIVVKNCYLLCYLNKAHVCMLYVHNLGHVMYVT